MSGTQRAAVALSTLVLSASFLPQAAAGTMSAEQAAIRFGAAFLLSWAGVSLLSALLAGYRPVDEPGEDPDRARDVVPGSEGPAR